MRVWSFVLVMVAALTFGLAAIASPLAPTVCRINPHPPIERASGQVSRALTQIAGIVDAHERSGHANEIASARDVGVFIAELNPQSIVGILNIIKELRIIGGISHKTSLSLIRILIDEIDPFVRQRSEIDIYPIRAYLKAMEWIISDNSENWIGRFEKIEESFNKAGICNERIFFLLSEIAEHIDVLYTPERARSRLEMLIERAQYLSGVGVNEIPLKWYAYQRLTAATVELCLFDLALPMLEKSQREAEEVLASPDAS